MVLRLAPKPTADDEVRESVSRLLRDTLAEAEAGKINGLVMIVSYVDGEWADRCSSTTRLSEAIGRLEITKQEWIAQYLGERALGAAGGQ